MGNNMDYQKWTFYVLCFLAMEHFALTARALVHQWKNKSKEDKAIQYWSNQLAELTKLQESLSKIVEFTVDRMTIIIENQGEISKQQKEACYALIAELDKKDKSE